MDKPCVVLTGGRLITPPPGTTRFRKWFRKGFFGIARDVSFINYDNDFSKKEDGRLIVIAVEWIKEA